MKCPTQRGLIFVMLAAALFHVAAVRAQGNAGTVAGMVSDASTGEPVAFAQILLEEVNRSIAADASGRFEIRFIPADSYTLKAYRIGYEPLIESIAVPAGDTLMLRLRMTESPLESGEVVVESDRADTRQLTDAAMEMEGRMLRQKLGTTIAETLADEPGFAMRSMGPAPARPVLRGLGGERLLVLEDGGRTGDLSATSTDHAVVIDPLMAERIEIVRGPAALVYGSNTLGGVVNVVRGYIPSSRPRRAFTAASLQGQSVNSGVSGGLGVTVPVGPFALKADGSMRSAGDVATPAGPLQNTDLTTVNGSVGSSISGGWGTGGAAVSYYASDYGIPGGFVGAHPNGVNIEMDRSHLEARAEIVEPMRLVPRLELRGSLSRYHHREFEDENTLGIEYGLLTYDGAALFHVHSNEHVRKGIVGLRGSYRNFASGGYSFTPNSEEWSIAGFGFQDIHFDWTTLQAGIRYDYQQITPLETSDSSIGDVRKRGFGGISASLRGMLHPMEGASVGATVMRSLRVPGIEELYSEGPHLAAYSFEIGNPDLGKEIGWGLETFGRYAGPRWTASLAFYYNHIQNFIYPRNTGTTDVRTLLPIFQQTGAEAEMLGTEAALEIRPHRMVRVGASTSYTRGTLSDAGEPLPWMPPLTGKLDASVRSGDYTIGATFVAAAEQDRVAALEQPTDGYIVVGAYAQYHFTTGSVLHTVDAVVENMTHSEYRDHLSRVKSVMPEPGRNIKLLYKLFF